MGGRTYTWIFCNGKMKQLIGGSDPRWLRIACVVLLFSLTILAVAIAFLLYFGKANESDNVDTSKFQAVFLTNGQVYFGKVAGINSQYIDIRDIYYLNSQQQDATGNSNKQPEDNSTFSLVKLGCELHGPSDKMIINREQVTFWENLTSEGKVVKAIDQWRSQNPDGQKCAEAKAGDDATQQQTGTPTTNTGTENTGTESQ
jgi:hypothetical protein